MTKRIRPKGTFPVMDVGNAQIPKEIRDELDISGKGTIAYVLSAKAALLFNPETEPIDIFNSLKVLEADLKLRIEDYNKRKEEEKGNVKGENV
jgi:hypothetical protein